MSRARFFSAWVLFTPFLVLGACSDPTSTGPGAEPPSGDAGISPTGEVTFHEHLEPLIQARCQGCHRPEGSGPFNLLTYEEARRRGAQLADETRARTMPPWGARTTEECTPPHPYVDDPSLTPEEIGLFERWVDAGMPEGDPAKAPPPRPYDPRAERLPRTDVSFAAQAPWSVAGSRDQFRCFVIDPGWPDLKYIAGIDFIPGNPKVVHHALTFLDPRRESLSKVDASGGYDCFGGPGLAETSLVSAWAPGGRALLLPEGSAMEVPGNSLLVVQVHYHPVPGSIETDHSGIEVQFLEGRPAYIVQALLIGNFERVLPNGDGLLPGGGDRGAQPEFRIPAGVRDHVETSVFTLPDRTAGGFPIPGLKILQVATHMHYVGVDMKWEIEHVQPRAGEPARECMVQTPSWNFQWQRHYTFDVPIPDAPDWRPGDRMHLRCTYDNTMLNPFNARALREQGKSAPEDVFLGEQTLDEMCLALVAVAYPNPFF